MKLVLTPAQKAQILGDQAINAADPQKMDLHPLPRRRQITRLAIIKLSATWFARQTSEVVERCAQWTVKGPCIQCGGPAAYLALRTFPEAYALTPERCYECAQTN